MLRVGVTHDQEVLQEQSLNLFIALIKPQHFTSV